MKKKYSGRTLLVLGGSRPSMDIVRAAQEMGSRVLVTDWYDSKKSPAKKIADKAFDISIADIDTLTRLVIDEKVDGVLTGFIDSYLDYYSTLCERTGLHCYGTKELFKFFVDKQSYLPFFSEHGVGVPKSFSLGDCTSQIMSGYLPLLVKPSDNSGARGISIARNHQELDLAIDHALRNSPSNSIVIEEYLENYDEVTAFILFMDGKSYLMGLADRFLTVRSGETLRLPILYRMPSPRVESFSHAVWPNLELALDKCNIPSGMMFLQIMVRETDYRVVDVGFRLTGTLEYKLFEAMYGFNPLKMMIDYALTGKNDQILLQKLDYMPGNKIGFNITILGRPGTISKISGGEEISSLPGIIDFAERIVEGDVITETMIGTLGQIVVRIFLKTANMQEAKKTIQEVYGLVDVLDDSGNSMILEKLGIERL